MPMTLMWMKLITAATAASGHVAAGPRRGLAHRRSRAIVLGTQQYAFDPGATERWSVLPLLESRLRGRVVAVLAVARPFPAVPRTEDGIAGYGLLAFRTVHGNSFKEHAEGVFVGLAGDFAKDVSGGCVRTFDIPLPNYINTPSRKRPTARRYFRRAVTTFPTLRINNDPQPHAARMSVCTYSHHAKGNTMHNRPLLLATLTFAITAGGVALADDRPDAMIHRRRRQSTAGLRACRRAACQRRAEGGAGITRAAHRLVPIASP